MILKIGRVIFAVLTVLVITTSAQAQLKIDGVPKREVFVGSQPIAISYTIFIKTGVEPIKEDLLNADVAPYTLISATVGKRVAIPQEKDLDMMQATLIVRPEAGWGLGEHPFPEIPLRYGYDRIWNDDNGQIHRSRRQGEAKAPGITLEKVPLYLETDLLHERAYIGDANVARLIIYAGDTAEVLNEVPPEDASADVTYLGALQLDEPLVLLSTDRDEELFTDFRVITYQYRFSVMDVPKHATFPFPSVTYKRSDDAETDIDSVEVGSSRIFMDSMLNKDTGFESPKGLAADPPGEMLWFFWLPLSVGTAIAAVLAVMLLRALVVFLRRLGERKKRAARDAGEDILLPEPVFEQRFYHRWLLGFRVNAACIKHNGAPGRETCAVVRSLTARFLASYAKERVSREGAAAMLGAELAALTVKDKTMQRWVAVVRQADEQLETEQYVRISVTPETQVDIVAGGSS